MQGGEISHITARFKDERLEAEYRAEAWPILRVQFGLTLCGLALGLLFTLSSDFAYLPGTGWLAPTAGLRGGAGAAGLVIGAWLLLVRPPRETRLVQGLIWSWFLAGLAAAVTVAFAFPAVETTADGRSDVLVFTAYWMCVFAIVVGFGFFPYPRAVAVFCTVLALTYLSLAALYWSSAAYPKISQSVLVVMACAFGWIMAVVTGVRTRRRFHLTKLYEEARAVAEKGLDLQKILLAATGHDMRQPVYALDLNAAALEAAADAGDLDKTRALARRQRQVARNVTGMLSSILRLSQFDTGRAEPQRDRVPVVDLFDEALEPLREFAADRGLEIRIVRSGLAVRIDRGIAVHILSNLVANAISHAGAGRLLCGARRRGEQVEIAVADDGAGFSAAPALYASLADLTAAADAPRKTGLGMEIMFRLAERGGLTLTLASRPGRGVLATLRAPRA
ncbi:MAG: sensor histidine kinase [Oceanicaulis sp.]